MIFSVMKDRVTTPSVFKNFNLLLLLIGWLAVSPSNAQMLGWVNGLGSSEKFEQGEKVLTDNAGNIYITGLFGNTVDFDFSNAKTELTAQGPSDVFFAKYNANRELQWVKSISGNSFEDVTDMVVDDMGNIYLTGGFDGTVDFDPGTGTQNLTGAGCDDIFLAKYNANGEYQWAFRVGGSQCDFGGNIALDNAGNLYLTGSLRQSTTAVDFDPGTGTQNLNAVGPSASIFVAKYSTDGAYQWAFVVGSTTEFKNMAEFETIWNNASNELIIAGRVEGVADFDPSSNTANLDDTNGGAFIAKYDKDGNYLSAKNFGAAETEARSMILDKAGNIYIGGSYRGTNVDFDPGTNTTTLTSKGKDDWFVAKYNNAVELQWVKGLGDATGNDFPEGIALDDADNVYIAGNFDGEINFNDPANTTKIQSKGSTDGLLVSYDKDGNYRFASNIGGNEFDTVNEIFIDQNNNGIYLTGSYSSTADFAINNGTATTLTTQGGEDIFLALYGEPEINLALNNRSIASGTTLNFGNIGVGSSSADSTIAIESKGVFELTLSGTAGSLVVLSGANASDFTITQTGVTSPINTGAQVTFTISYTPSAEGAASALLTIQSNDSNEGTYTVQLAGTGVNNVTSISAQTTELTWKVGPNPTAEHITIYNQQFTAQSIRYQIVDQKGKVCLSHIEKVNKGSVTLNLSQIPKGQYLLVLQAGNKQVTKRIVKR